VLSVLRFTSALVVLFVGLLCGSVAHAQSNSTGTPPGVTCGIGEHGETSCKDTNGNTLYTCTTAANGDRECTGSNNGSGYSCTTLSTGELSCTGSSVSGGTGGGSTATGGGFVSKLTGWASGAMSSAGNSIVALVKDAVVWIVKAILGLFAAIVAAIPIPDFISQYSLSNLLSFAGPDVGWFLQTFKISEGLTVLGSGYAFRMLRKLITLFQW